MNFLQDNHQRFFNYLRLSITELCNFKCTYCLPNGYQKREKKEYFLSINEIDCLVNAFAELGVKKIRITGGEPTLRRDLIEIIQKIKENDGIEQIAMTTNGYRIFRDAKNWKSAGLNALNISVDSLDPNIFYQITGEDKLAQILAGIEKSLEIGFDSIKMNVVLLKNLNVDLAPYLNFLKNRLVQIRFIELMETGLQREYFHFHHFSGQIIQQKLIEMGWQKKEKSPLDGPAEIFYHSDYLGEFGLIMPYSPDFCKNCNRLRVSSKGNFHLCLFGENGVPLRHFLEESAQKELLKSHILLSLREKKSAHFLQEHYVGMSNNLAYIGG